MKLPKTVKLKTYIATVAIILTISFATISYVTSQSTGTFTISQGIYPGAPTYTIWKEGSTYYAKDAYGRIPSWGSGTNASAVIQNAIDALFTTGGKILIKNGDYTISSTINISRPSDNYAKLIIEGEGWGSFLDSASAPYVFRLNPDGVVTGKVIAGVVIRNMKIYVGNGTAIWAYNPFACVFQNLEIYHASPPISNSIGIHIIGGEGNKIANNWIHDLGTGIKITYDGIAPVPATHTIRDNVLNYFTNFVLYLSRNHKTLIQGNDLLGARNTTLWLEDCSTCEIDNNWFESAETQLVRHLYLLAKDSSSETNTISNNHFVSTASIPIDEHFKIDAIGVLAKGNVIQNNRFGGPKLALNITNNNVIQTKVYTNTFLGSNPVIDNGDRTDFEGNIGFITENSGTATISASTSVTFDHGLAGTPTHVEVGFQDAGYGSWTWSATATNITITVEVSGTYDFSWRAYYEP